MVKDENDISDILSGLKQVDDNSSIGLIDDINIDSNNDVDDLLGGLKQIDSDIIQHDDDKFEKDAMDNCLQ